MGAWGARFASLLVVAFVVLSAWPTASAFFQDLPVAHESVVLGDGSATFRFASSAEPLTFEVEASANGTLMLRIDVMDPAGALLASAETLLRATDARANVRVDGDALDVSYRPASHDGFSGRGSGLPSECVESVYVSGTFSPDGGRRLAFGLTFEPACAASATSVVLAAAGDGVDSSTFRLRSEGVVGVVDERHGGADVIAIEAFRALTTAHVNVEMVDAAATTGATHAVSLPEGWIGSFGLTGGDDTMSLTATSPSGAARECPCLFAGGEEGGEWTFAASAGVSSDAPYLFVAQP